MTVTQAPAIVKVFFPEKILTAAAATKLEISRDKVYRRYERLAKKYNLKLTRQGRE
jgi:hypothetical protein